MQRLTGHKNAKGPTPKRILSKKAHAAEPGIPLPVARPAAADLPPDLAAIRQAIELVRQDNGGEATKLMASIGDPVAQKLVEWALLRQVDSEPGLESYVAFIRNNPDWPSIPLLRRDAEAKLWQDRRNAATVRAFFATEKPTSPLGKLALARVLLSTGDRAGAAAEVRAVWRSAQLYPATETAVLRTFPDELTGADDVVRMDRRIGAQDFDAAMRVAKRLGDDQVAIVKACIAAEANSTNARKLLDAVPSEARGDLGYTLCQIHSLVHQDDLATAAKLVLAVSPEDLQHQDTDEWWRELRQLARKLIDHEDTAMAYAVVQAAALPARPNYRVEFHFMAGWIALRFLDDPITALKHFAHVDDDSTDPIVRARAAYWRARAEEAIGNAQEMRVQYEAAARYPTAYYGQLARAQLGLPPAAFSRTPSPVVNGVDRELVHAAHILYRIDEHDLVLSFMTDLAKESTDVTLLAALGQLAAQHYNDAHAMLLIGKTALARGLPMEQYAFPDFGVPPYNPIQLDRGIVYSIVRTESAFDQQDRSRAMAVGLMQVTPEGGRDTAKQFRIAYDWDRLVSDPVYNTQMGAVELSGLLKAYRSYIMAFAAYNAGAGRVEQWVAEHGDPRDPKIDPVDWVERIPLAETRNYVERVMENLQVYRARFGATTMTFELNLQSPLAGLLRAEPNTLAQSTPTGPGLPKQSAPERPRHARRARASPADLRTIDAIERASPQLSPPMRHSTKPHIIRALHKSRRCCLPRGETRSMRASGFNALSR
jgi:soluble lytic murein transglycosylase